MTSLTKQMSARTIAIAMLLIALSMGSSPCSASVIISDNALDRLAVQRYWHADVPIPPGESIVRTVLLDDNLYLITNRNLAFVVHARTGVLRWSAQVAEPDQTVRGPTHSDQYALFTTPGAVKVFHRATGELAGEPRKLRGVIIDVAHDIATVSIGRVHGVRADDILKIVRVGADEDDTESAIAQLRVTIVNERQAKGRIIRQSRTIQVQSGMRVAADVVLPLRSVKLPFAASSPAVANTQNLFVGAANQRVYSLDYLTGVVNWQVMTPKTLSATPILRGEDLYYGGQDGRIVSCTSEDRVKNWVFDTEGPIFADLVVDQKHVFAASTDRLLYCLDRKKGNWIWRKRFDNPPGESPRVAMDRVYQPIPNEGMFVLDANTGETLWRRPEDGRFLAQFGRDTYLMSEAPTKRLLRVRAGSGKEKAREGVGAADFAEASQADQLIVLATKLGRMECLRPKHAPRLKSTDVAEVLRNDRTTRALTRSMAQAREKTKNKVAAKPRAQTKVRLDFLDEDDWLTSRSHVRPAGSSGLVKIEENRSADKKKVQSDEDEYEDSVDEDDSDEDEYDESLDEDDSEDDDESLDEDDSEDDDES
ncbi:MAG: PQQ-binding-like beta-propeller repeat protein, partial [Phycisphaerae bacterium]